MMIVIFQEYKFNLFGITACIHFLKEISHYRYFIVLFCVCCTFAKQRNIIINNNIKFSAQSFLSRKSISMWFAASGFQDILLSQFLPQLFIFFLFIHPLFTLVRNRLNFNFSLIMQHDDGIQALTCTSDMLKDNGRRFKFFVLKRINMLWKNS